MSILIVLSHPDSASLSHAAAAAVAAGVQSSGRAAVIADLHAEGFDPRAGLGDVRAMHGQSPLPPDVVREQQRLAQADGVAFVYPTWWFERPVMLKGWCDRVLTGGFAFRFGAAGIEGLPGHKRAWIITPTGMPEAFYAQHGGFASVLGPMVAGTLGVCGIAAPTLTPLFGAPFVPPQVRADWLATLHSMTTHWCAPQPVPQ